MGGVQSTIDTIITMPTFEGGVPGFDYKTDTDSLFPNFDTLLVELNRDQQLPNGTGNQGFIVIPDNLHPFIKDNLEYFLIRAGINVSGDASQYLKLDETNRNLL